MARGDLYTSFTLRTILLVVATAILDLEETSSNLNPIVGVTWPRGDQVAVRTASE